MINIEDILILMDHVSENDKILEAVFLSKTISNFITYCNWKNVAITKLDVNRFSRVPER